MKALSLWQPWATLIAIGAKMIETRGWHTSYRGSLLIHAAKRPDGAKDLEAAIFRLRPSDRDGIRCYLVGSYYWHAITSLYQFHHVQIGGMIPKLPLGSALCIVDLVDCVPTENIGGLTMQERAFGDYSRGRYAWKLSNLRRFEKPIPMRGAQGLFNSPIQFKPEVEAKL